MRKPQLDGLRCFLFVSVFLTHHFPARAEFLGYALPVFFVLSGFLITRILLATDHPTLGGKLRVFYARRILRICPAYYLVVIGLWAFGRLTYPVHYFTYTLNLKLFALSLWPDPEAFRTWLQDQEHWRKDSLHLWSLSVEEQFYLCYPLILYLTPARRRTAMLVVGLVGSVLTRTWFLAYYPHAFYGALLPLCAEYFIWGCLFSWLQEQNALARLQARRTLPLAMAGIVGTLVVEFSLHLNGYFQWRTTHFQTPLAFFLGLFIWSLWTLPPTHAAARLLSWRPFVYFGEITYTLYLTHLLSWDVYAWWKGAPPPDRSPELILGTLVITVALSMAIWHLVEKPMNGLKRYVSYTTAPEPAPAPEVARS